jgi:hypothetical protein
MQLIIFFYMHKLRNYIDLQTTTVQLIVRFLLSRPKIACKCMERPIRRHNGFATNITETAPDKEEGRDLKDTCVVRASALVWSDRLSHAFTRNLGSTQQTTYTMTCLVSRLIDLYNSFICAHKKMNIMSCRAITTHTMVVELSHEVVVSFMMWLFREATTFFSLLALSPPHHKKSYVALHGTTYGTADVYQYTCLHWCGLIGCPMHLHVILG